MSPPPLLHISISCSSSTDGSWVKDTVPILPLPGCQCPLPRKAEELRARTRFETALEGCMSATVDCCRLLVVVTRVRQKLLH
jgi:hypothetical protein